METSTVALTGIAAHVLTRMLKSGALDRAIRNLFGRGIPHRWYGWIAMGLAAVIATVEGAATNNGWTAAIVHGVLGGVAAIGIQELGVPVAQKVGGAPASRAIFGSSRGEPKQAPPVVVVAAPPMPEGNDDPTIAVPMNEYHDRKTNVVGGVLLCVAMAHSSSACLPPAKTAEEDRRRSEVTQEATKRVFDVVVTLAQIILSEHPQDPAVAGCVDGLVAKAEAAIDGSPVATEGAYGVEPDPCVGVAESPKN